MTDFSEIALQKFTDSPPKGPFIKFRRERVGVPDAEFWLSVGDEILVSTGNQKAPMISFTIVEVKDEPTFGSDPATGD